MVPLTHGMEGAGVLCEGTDNMRSVSWEWKSTLAHSGDEGE